jgi:uncharacterized protein (TIGR03435 family)
VKLADLIRRSNYGATLLALFAVLPLAFAESTATPATAPQPPAAQPLVFEVASVRMVSPHSADDLVEGIGVFSVCAYPTNHFFVHYAPLRIILSMIFDDTSPHVLGHDWLDSQLYSIDAKVEGDAKLSREEIKPLLRKLLEERFHLQAHTGTRTAPGFALTIAKSGPKLDPGKPRKLSGGQLLPGRLQMWHVTVESFAQFLASPAGHPVVNKTGITGTYDFDLRFSPANDPDPNLPDLFTALQEQLGLKLVPEKVPVDYFVVDHVEKIPTEN